MIKPNMIPDEAAFALLDIYALWLGDADQARAAIAAALNSWPDSILMPAEIILPLPQENANAEG